jgi:hypothetical protein
MTYSTVHFFSPFVFFAMNRLVAFLFILIYSDDSMKVKSSDSLAPYAIKGIIDQFAAGNNREIEIFNCGAKNGKGEKMFEKLLQLENLSIALKNIKYERKDSDPEWFYLKATQILVFDSMENFKHSFKHISFDINIKTFPSYLIYIPGFAYQVVKTFPTNVERILRTYFFADETHESIALATPFEFTPEACGKNQWKIINRFSRATMRWENPNSFATKYENYHKCPMKLQYFEGKYETELFSILAEYLNFTPVMTNEKRINLTRFDISLSRGITSVLDDNFYWMTFMHFEQSKIFIPPGELYGDYEKMLLPFDTLTWIGIVLTIVSGVLVIVLIKWLSPSNQELYFGRNNRSPLMNFISIILNGDQYHDLAENLPRMLLMLFIIWCLIFR